MPRFYFNYREQNEYAVDDVGIEFDTLELAYLDAFNSAREMWPELMLLRVDPRTASFEILNEAGHLLAVISFGEALENCEIHTRASRRKIDKTFARRSTARR